MSSRATPKAPNRSNVRYGWNTDYNAWEIFSEEGIWLGISAAPRPPPSRLRSLDETITQGTLDLTHFDDQLPPPDLDSKPPHQPVGAGGVSASQDDTRVVDDEDTPKARHQPGDETFVNAPPGLPKFGYDLMAANSTSMERSEDVRSAYQKSKSAKAAMIGKSNSISDSVAHFTDSSPPAHDSSNSTQNTLEQNARDLIRTGEKGKKHGSQKRRRGVETTVVSNEADNPQRARKRSRTKGHTASIEEEIELRRTQDDPFLTLFDVDPVTASGPRDCPPTQPKVQTSFHVDPDAHPALIELAAAAASSPSRSPLEEEEAPAAAAAAAAAEDLAQGTTGMARGTPVAVENTLVVPAGAGALQQRRASSRVTVTEEDLRRYSFGVCASLAEAMREQRVLNLRRGIMNSLFDGYRKWHREGKLAEWRNAMRERETRSPEADRRATDLHMEWLLGNEPDANEVAFDREPKTAKADTADIPLPSIEHDAANDFDPPLDQPSDAYHGWDRRWYDISNNAQ